jgi:hypothetical protein
MQDIYIYTVPMPSKIEGITVYKNNDYIVLINNELNKETQDRAIQHEIKHINQNHLYDYRSVELCEVEAGGRRLL